MMMVCSRGRHDSRQRNGRLLGRPGEIDAILEEWVTSIPKGADRAARARLVRVLYMATHLLCLTAATIVQGMRGFQVSTGDFARTVNPGLRPEGEACRYISYFLP
jgi:hypothetical protein